MDSVGFFFSLSFQNYSTLIRIYVICCILNCYSLSWRACQYSNTIIWCISTSYVNLAKTNTTKTHWKTLPTTVIGNRKCYHDYTTILMLITIFGLQTDCHLTVTPTTRWGMSPGLKKRFYITITTPVMSTLKVSLGVNTPINTSAVITIVSLRFVSSSLFTLII